MLHKMPSHAAQDAISCCSRCHLMQSMKETCCCCGCTLVFEGQDNSFLGKLSFAFLRVCTIFVSLEPWIMKHLFLNIWQFYRDGFRGMKLGRTLWMIILIKLFVMFFILRLFFFPDFLKQETGGGRQDGYVSRELIDRMPPR